MVVPVPLTTLLSQLLVAFTIEFDNEFENRMPHRTTNAGREASPKGSPWLVSQVMWVNVMQHIGGEGISVEELHARSRTVADSLAGLERWKYVVVTPVAEAGEKPEVRVRPTSVGNEAQAIWRPLAAEIEARWVRRFGPEVIGDLRLMLEALRVQFEADLPQYLPVVSPTQNGKVGERLLLSQPKEAPDASSRVDLSVLLAQVLLQFALDYEADAGVSLTIAANTLRVLNEAGVPVRDLPRLTGVSKEGNSMALGFLARRGCVALEPDSEAGRGKRARLTAKGKASQNKYHRLLNETEDHWRNRFGADNITALRRALQRVEGDEASLRNSRLAEGLTPYADGWRAAMKPAETLPHYPMVLHRGGYPDGS